MDNSNYSVGKGSQEEVIVIIKARSSNGNSISPSVPLRRMNATHSLFQKVNID